MAEEAEIEKKGNVVPLRLVSSTAVVVSPPKDEAAEAPVIDEDVIRVLKEWVDMAERGELVAVALAGVGPTYQSLYETADYGKYSTAMLGAICVLDTVTRTLVIQADEETEEEGA